MRSDHQMFGGAIRRRRGMVGLLLLLVTALALSACSSNPGTSATSTTSAGGTGGAIAGTKGHPATIRVDYVYATTLLPVYIADVKGFFHKHGLNFQGSQEASPVTATEALNTSFDLVMQTPSGFLAAAQQGLPVIAVSNCAENSTQSPNTYVMVAKNSSIKTLKDLVGKRVGVVNVTSASTIALQYVALKEGLGANAFNFVTVPFSSMLDQLQAGNIDAAVPVVPFSTAMQQAGYRSIATPTVQASKLAVNSDKSANAFFIANKTWAEQHRTVIAAWRASLSEAIDWITAHKTQALQLAIKFTGLPANVVKSSPPLLFQVKLTTADLKAQAIEDQAVGVTKTLVNPSKLILP